MSQTLPIFIKRLFFMQYVLHVSIFPVLLLYKCFKEIRIGTVRYFNISRASYQSESWLNWPANYLTVFD